MFAATIKCLFWFLNIITSEKLEMYICNRFFCLIVAHGDSFHILYIKSLLELYLQQRRCSILVWILAQLEDSKSWDQLLSYKHQTTCYLYVYIMEVFQCEVFSLPEEILRFEGCSNNLCHVLGAWTNW